MILLINILLALVFGSNSFENELKSYLNQKLSPYEKFEYEIVKLPNNSSKILIDKTKDFRLSKNYGYVPVKIFRSKNECQSSVLTIKLKLYKKVFVTKSIIKKDDEINSNKVEEKLYDVSLLNGKPLNTAENISEYKARTNLKDNLILLEEHVKKIPLIAQGEKVFVHAGNNGVDITLEAITRQAGYLGEIISVQAFNKIYKAKVLDKYNLALVE